MKIKSFTGAIVLAIAMFWSFGANAQSETVYFQGDTQEQAQLSLGKQAISDYTFANVVYPAKAVGSGVSGMVTIKFIIETDGTISNVEVERGLNSLIDAEAIRVISAIPGKCVPAKVDGVNVRSLYYLPVLFSDPGK